MRPRDLLATWDSNDLSEMMAYEQFAGPLDSTWDSEVRGQMHELLQQLLLVTIDVNSKKPSKQKVRPVPRPWWTPEQEEAKKPNVVAGLDAELALREQHAADSGYGATYM